MEEEEGISEKRNRLTTEIFGKPEDYMETEENADDSVNESKAGRWLLVIILSIIALVGGVWTAIGVFLLGYIFVISLKK